MGKISIVENSTLINGATFTKISGGGYSSYTTGTEARAFIYSGSSTNTYSSCTAILSPIIIGEGQNLHIEATMGVNAYIGGWRSYAYNVFIRNVSTGSTTIIATSSTNIDYTMPNDGVQYQVGGSASNSYFVSYTEGNAGYNYVQFNNVYIETPYAVSAEITPNGGGEVSGVGNYLDGTNITLEAIPNGGYGFVNWNLKGYTRLEYIESTGTQYVDIGFKGNLNTQIEMKIKQITNSTNKTICPIGDNTTSTKAISPAISMNSTSRTIRFGDKSTTMSNKATLDTDYTLVFNKANLTLNGVVIWEFNATSTFETTNNLTLGKINGIDDAYNNGGLRIYWSKIYDNDILVRDYIPCIRHRDGAIGLLDLCELKFYDNSGTGSFLGGGIYAS